MDVIYYELWLWGRKFEYSKNSCKVRVWKKARGFHHVYGSSITYSLQSSGSSHSNLDPMKVIMQELQLMRNDMKEMRWNITNLSMEHRDQSNIREHTTSHTQWGCAWEQEVESLFYSYGVREEEKIMKKVLRNRFGVGNHEGQRKGQAKGKFMESSGGDKTAKVDELSQVQDRRTTHNCKGWQYYTMNPLSPQQVHEEERKMREKDRVECEMKKKSISEDKRIE
ncbi:hypothetical protein M9H77_08725 [Catharanthus roseus]|uniref:Uncharacterized protein n=1 Tax=Catharanthus roseus TaxID=4058 RepID=A0ACC0BYR2_CATRO|nr:hypothetical protein M9H77_08725 [Catharanthus roseus]